MAKRIKFPLKMGNGESVRNIEELRENFDLSSVMTYFTDGKLLTWLENRYYEKEIEEINTLKQDDPDLGKKLCDIFGVAYEKIIDKGADFSIVAQRNQKLSELKQYTTDTNLYEKIESIAFTQKEFQELLEKKLPEIYLLNNTFVIPLNLCNVTLNGIGTVIVQVFSDQYIDFEKQNVIFNNISFDEAYQNIFISGERKRLEIIADEQFGDKNYSSAINFYKQAEALGSIRACKQLGFMFYRGLGVKNDFQSSFEYYQKASSAHDGEATCNVGQFYYLGKYVKPDGLKAKELYQRGIKENCNEGYRLLGELYSYGCENVGKDWDIAMQYFEEALKHGSNKAKHYLGRAYINDDNPLRDYDLGRQYLLESGQEGNPESYYVLGEQYREDISYYNGGGRNPEKAQKCRKLALEYLQIAGDRGIADGYYLIGEIFFDEKNFTEAFRWFLKADENGSVAGTEACGTLYLCHEENYEKAEYYLKKAVDLGSDESRYLLGQIYEDASKSPSGKSEYQKAYNLYKTGADYGNTDCMRGLAEMYLNGNDAVERDLELAEKWIGKAKHIAYENKKMEDYEEYTQISEKIKDTINPNRQKFVVSQNDTSCFITTAVCGSLNKPDDCDELMSMRWLRDKLKAEDEDMAALIEEYYRVAPLVVKKIDNTADAPAIYRQLWDNSISKIYGDIKHKDYRDAKLRYISMLENLCARYDEPLANGIYEKINRIRKQ